MIETILNHLEPGIFWLFCLLTIGGGLYVLLSNHVLYAAYGMLVSFLGVAGIFIFAHADFVSAAQIMIYVGGILILMIFGIMLSSNKKMGIAHLQVDNKNKTLGIGLVATLTCTMLLLCNRLNFIDHKSSTFLPIKDLGFALMSNYVLVLEIIGMLLLMALIGATYIAKDDK